MPPLCLFIYPLIYSLIKPRTQPPIYPIPYTLYPLPPSTLSCTPLPFFTQGAYAALQVLSLLTHPLAHTLTYPPSNIPSLSHTPSHTLLHTISHTLSCTPLPFSTQEPMLLYKYYRLHERFPQAAAHMYQLAQQVGHPSRIYPPPTSSIIYT